MSRILYLFLLLFLTSVSLFAQVQGDSLNRTDENYFRQGYWKIYGKDNKRLLDYAPEQLIEEGLYKDNMKTGVWKKYFPNGKLMSEITYTNNRAEGYAKLYYQNGKLKEEGMWQINKWTGGYKFYYESGELYQDFKFSGQGKRDGEQKYFHDNGKKMIEGDWKEGKEHGVIKEYDRTGDLIVERFYDDGKMDVAKSVIYKELDSASKEITPPTGEFAKKEKESVKEQPGVAVVQQGEKKEETNIGIFNGNGFHRLYNQNKQISKVGVFKNFKLVDGKVYKYDDNGLLVKIELYKKGSYFGEVPLEQDKDEKIEDNQ